MVLAIILAFPMREIGRDSSALMPKYTVKLPGVIMIFLSQGLCLDPTAVTKAFTQCHIIVYVSIFSFVVYPAAVMILTSLLEYMGYNEYFRVGMIVTSVMPTTTA